MDVAVALATLPVVFLGELPDKTMFANLVMATRGRPLAVWTGAALAFAVHVAIAVTVGAALIDLAPRRAVDAIAAGIFLFGAGLAWHEAGRPPHAAGSVPRRRWGTATTALVVIFLAEWGDLTQLLTADLAARTHQPLAVAVGAYVALLAVAALAVTGGRLLTRVASTGTVRRVTAVVLVGLAAASAWTAAR